MNIFKSDSFLFLEINLQEIKNYHINIHNLLTNCEYCIDSGIKLILKEYIDIDIEYFSIISSSFFNNTFTIEISTFPEIQSLKLYSKYLKNNVNRDKKFKHTYINVKHSKDKNLFSSFYEYLNNSIYSKYISIKNGIIFIKDKSKEKYILNYISEFE